MPWLPSSHSAVFCQRLPVPAIVWAPRTIGQWVRELGRTDKSREGPGSGREHGQTSISLVTAQNPHLRCGWGTAETIKATASLESWAC